MTQNSINTSDELQQILCFCRHIAGAAPIIAVSLLGEQTLGKLSAKATFELILVIRDFQPRLMSYVKNIGGRTIIIFAVDQWVFERDVERGFLGEALASALIFPYTALCGKEYLYKQEIMLKKRLILELLENLVQTFPELSHNFQIKPEYFMYEVMLNRIRIFPPLSYSHSKFMSETAPKRELELVFHGYMEALKQLEKEEKILFSNGYVLLHKKFVAESKNPKIRLANLSRNAPRALFTSVFNALPQLLNAFSQNTDALLNFQKFSINREADVPQRLVDPQKYIFVPTAQGLVSLADRIDINTFVRKMLLNGEKADVTFNRVGGVLNDVYLITASAQGVEKKVIVKRFKDWSGFKWFPLALWSFGARSFAVLGRTRLEKECAISERLRCEGFNVPKILYVNHKERLVFMEYVEGEDLSNAIKRIATSEKTEENLAKITMVGEIFARVHTLDIALGDTKPENIICTSDDKIYLLDFEQASYGGDKSWDIAEFLYYSGHYLPPLYSNGKAEAIATAFISGYLKEGGDVHVIRKAGASKYTRVFSVFTLPSILLAMSKACRKAEARR
ncbi:MAG: AarF/UbiB family protein [Candidatus Bathyarchaeota archaeon]|nr:AarF/UbiB family protein [Candidatus Bathyarchaeota archaeon]